MSSDLQEPRETNEQERRGRQTTSLVRLYDFVVLNKSFYIK
jgi:hypothetical protein